MEVKAICQHWNLLEIIKGVVTRTTSDLTGQRSYSRLVPLSMRIEIFQRIHGYDMGHFGYDKIYPLFSERFFWPGMSTDVKAWLNCCSPQPFSKLAQDQLTHLQSEDQPRTYHILDCIAPTLPHYVTNKLL